jgi:predicted alpha/beta-fold hydrolase
MIKIILLIIISISYNNYKKYKIDININDLFLYNKILHGGKFIELINNDIYCYKNNDKKYVILCKKDSKIESIFNNLDNFKDYNIPQKNYFKQIYLTIKREISEHNFEKILNNYKQLSIYKFIINNRFVLEMFTNKKKSNKLIFINHGIFSHIRRHSIKYFLDNNYDICILWRNNSKVNNNDDFIYEPFDASFELNESIKLINNKFKYDKILILNYSAGCFTSIKYAINQDYIKPTNLKGFILVSAAPNARNNLKNLSKIIDYDFKKKLFHLLNKNAIQKYKINTKMTIEKIIGNIGCINNNMDINMENIDKYYLNLDINYSKLTNIKKPFFLINSLDDNVSRIKNYGNINKYLVNDVGFFILDKGYHTHFYNDLNDTFLESVIINFFNKI